MAFFGELLSGAIKPEEISRALQPILKDAEANIAAALSTAIEGGLDRIRGAKMTNVITVVTTFELPAARAIPVKPEP